MTEDTPTKKRARLEKVKSKHRAKIEILNEIVNWIELGKGFEEIQEHCNLSIDYHNMQIDVLKEQVKKLFYIEQAEQGE
jgi:hypothetical protein|tara:strand:- start:4 stop:240 length:237 start_codon:yes stop_codon:yes gene_type:complete